MLKSKVVLALAELASKVSLPVTPSNVNTLAREMELLFGEAANLINELEAAEKAAAETDKENNNESDGTV